MGKKDGAQRTKGNTKPSSSARSAELLGSGFVGFGSLPPLPGWAGAPPSGGLPAPGTGAPADGGALWSGVDLEGSAVPSQAKVVLKRMNKRDVTTKIKALQEFHELVPHFTEADIKCILPFWTRVYLKVAADHDRRVREGAQRANGSVVVKAGRSLAPHLKSLMPTWFLWQMDPFPPAASLAQAAFHETFSAAKRRQVLIFCQKEILGHIQDNLLRQTPQTLSDPKMTSKEDMESKFERTLAASLLAYSNFLVLVHPAKSNGSSELTRDVLGDGDVGTTGAQDNGPEDEDMSKADEIGDREEMAQFEHTLLESGKFWKFANHKSPHVRSSWFGLLSSLCQVSPTLFQDHPSQQPLSKDNKGKEPLVKITQAIFTHLDDSDPLVSGSVWDAALALTFQSQKWMTMIDIEACVLLKFRRVLQKGCQGNGREIYPKILPLLSRLPHEMLFAQGPNSQLLLEGIFAAFKDGTLEGSSIGRPIVTQPSSANPTIVEERVQVPMGSKLTSDQKQGVQAYFECAFYVFTEASRKDLNLSKNLANHISSWIEDIFQDGSLSPETEVVFVQLGRLLSLLAGKIELSSVFDTLWSRLYETALQFREAAEGDSSHLALLNLLMVKTNPGQAMLVSNRKTHSDRNPRVSKIRFQLKNETNSPREPKEDPDHPSRIEIDRRPSGDEEKTLPPSFLSFEDKWMGLTTQLATRAWVKFEEAPLSHINQIGFFNNLVEACGTKTGFYSYLAQHLTSDPNETKAAQVCVGLSSAPRMEVAPRDVEAAQDIMEQRVLPKLGFFVADVNATDVDRSRIMNEVSLLAHLVYRQALAQSNERARKFLLKILTLDDPEWIDAFLNVFGPRKKLEEDSNVSIWLGSPQYAQLVQREVTNLLQADQSSTLLPRQWNLLKSLWHHGDFLGESVLRSLFGALEQIVRELSDVESEWHRIRLTLVCDLLERVQESNRLCWHVSQSHDLIMALLGLDCANQLVYRDDSLQARLAQAWMQGSRVILAHQQGGDEEETQEAFCQRLAHVIKSNISLCLLTCEASPPKVDEGAKLKRSRQATSLIRVANAILQVLLEEGTLVDKKWVQKTFVQMLPSAQQWMDMRAASRNVEMAYFLLSHSPGRGFAIFQPDDLELGDNPDHWRQARTQDGTSLDSMITLAIFVDSVWPTIFTSWQEAKAMTDGQDGAINTPPPWSIDLHHIDLLFDSLCEHLYSVTVIGHILLQDPIGLFSGPNGDSQRDLWWTQGSSELEHVQKMCWERTPRLLSQLSPTCAQMMMSRLLDKSSAQGLGWALTFQEFVEGLASNDELPFDLDLHGLWGRIYGDLSLPIIGRVQTAQVILGLCQLGSLPPSPAGRSRYAGNRGQSLVVRTIQSTLERLLEEHGTKARNVTECHASLAVLGSSLHTWAEIVAHHHQPDPVMFSSRSDKKEALIASGITISSLPRDGEMDEMRMATSLLDWLTRQKDEHENDFLFARAIDSPQDGQSVVFVRLICNILSSLLELARNRHGTEANSEIERREVPLEFQESHWDMILCSLSSWVQTIDESNKQDDQCCLNPLWTGLATDVVDLLGSVARVFQDPDSSGLNVPQHSRDEWKDFFCDGMYSVLFTLFNQMASETRAEGQANLSHARGQHRLLSHLAAVVIAMPEEQLLAHSLEPIYLVDDVDSDGMFPDNLLFLLNHLCPLMTSELRPLQMSSYHLIARIVNQLVSEEEKCDERAAASSQAHSPESDDGCREFPRRFSDLLSRTQPVVMSLFGDFEFADPMILPEPSTAFTYTMAYLLVWRLILRLTSQASEELRPKYTETMRRDGSMDVLIPTLFHLMLVPNLDAQGENELFVGEPNLSPRCKNRAIRNERKSRNELQEVACKTYRDLLRQLPAMIRNWWINSEKKKSDLMENFTVKHVTPMIWQEQVEIITKSQTTFKNMSIKVRPSVREVVATYTVDDGSMELVVTLPSNFPLGPVKVESGRRVGVEPGQWRNWMLQLTTFLQNQDGSILDSLVVWKRNVDKRFEGVEECYICFYVLHGANHQLPKLACRACKKKFHSACLFKWFSTSNNSTCPLCRSLF